MKTEDIILIGKALSDKNRVEIIKLLSDNELCACHILENLNISQPTLSHHMKTLTESKLVNVTKKGTWNYYTINRKTINEFTEFLNNTPNTYDNTTCGC